MQKIVSITSQGQITIPAKMRGILGLGKYKRASVRLEKGKIIVEPVPDLLTLAGSLKDKAIKGKSIQEIIKLEEESIARSFGRARPSK